MKSWSSDLGSIFCKCEIIRKITRYGKLFGSFIPNCQLTFNLQKLWEKNS